MLCCVVLWLVQPGGSSYATIDSLTITTSAYTTSVGTGDTAASTRKAGVGVETAAITCEGVAVEECEETAVADDITSATSGVDSKNQLTTTDVTTTTTQVDLTAATSSSPTVANGDGDLFLLATTEMTYRSGTALHYTALHYTTRHHQRTTSTSQQAIPTPPIPDPHRRTTQRPARPAAAEVALILTSAHVFLCLSACSVSSSALSCPALLCAVQHCHCGGRLCHRPPPRRRAVWCRHIPTSCTSSPLW